MAWNHRVSGLSKGDLELIGSEKNDEFQFKNASASDGHPKWVHGVWGFVKLKYEEIGEK
jgi:hypothetical protein